MGPKQVALAQALTLLPCERLLLIKMQEFMVQ